MAQICHFHFSVKCNDTCVYPLRHYIRKKGRRWFLFFYFFKKKTSVESQKFFNSGLQRQTAWAGDSTDDTRVNTDCCCLGNIFLRNSVLTKHLRCGTRLQLVRFSPRKTHRLFQITLTEDIWHWHSRLSIKVGRSEWDVSQPTFRLVSEITGATQTEPVMQRCIFKIVRP